MAFQATADMKDEEVLLGSHQEPALFEILVDRYQQPLFRAAFRILRNHEESQDVVQEAFLKMYRNAHKFEKVEGIEFKSWAYKVTINTAITHYRKLKKGPIAVEDVALFDQAENGSAGDEHIALLADAQALVSDTLEKMPEALRGVLEQYYLEDKSYETIAEKENIPLSTLKMRLFRARRLFKKISGGFDI